ncbi:hypothetical protein SHI21_02680 [Bacteriovorax sp. PP10]|uniref:Uncharacterized protein n=1 Tax=Bacteriovorax antarcticus TaxID=3088717 RepID=A0ABU5VST9_9BACT|nr:hypothetical protein [Bacteriovorax sp. PP10]MEA9355085.1 hypothetical protein [Bacteriovorax sp. PP10]
MNFKRLVLSTLLVLSTSLHARGERAPERDPWNTRPTTPRDQQDPWGNQGSIRDVELQVGRYFEGQARLDLLQDAYTRSQLQGQRIKEVTITASTEAGNGQARLLVNQQSSEQPRIIARQMARYTFAVDPFANSINQGLRTLELEMRGRFYVEKVVFGLVQNSGPVNPGPGIPSQPQTEVVRQQFNEVINQEGGLNLFRNFNLGIERQGQAVRRISVLARSQSGYAQGQLLINDQGSGQAQSIGTSSTRLTFDLSGQRIGREIQGLRLQFRGYLVVEEVTLEFEKGGSIPGPGPGPILERRIEQSINQRIYDTSGVNLTALMRIDRRHEDRIVDSVEIFLRGSDYGVNLKLCQQVLNSGPYPTVNCGANSMVTPGMQVIRLSSLNYAKLIELSLSVRMGMIDIDRIAINFR